MPSSALEGQAEQPVGGVERRLDDVVELEVRLDRRLVEVAAAPCAASRRSSASPTARAAKLPPSSRHDRPAWRRGRRARAARAGAQTVRAGRAPPPASSPWRRRAGNARRSGSRAACARSARSATISAMIALLSVLPPLSPRAIQARNAFSRRSRRDENCRNGSTLERASVMTCLPGRPRSSAAARAAARTKSGRPARSASPSSISV